VPFILAAEKLMDVEAPPRAQHIRTILFELARIANVSCCSSADMAVQVGAITPVFFAFRDREHILNMIESATGGRFHPNFDRIGGLKDDLPKGWIEETRGALRASRRSATNSRTSSWATRSSRPARVVLVSSRATSHCNTDCRAPTCVRPGVDWDLRRDAPCGLVYDKVNWKVWTHPDGDSFARYWVRLQETREACKILDQLLGTIPAGPIMAKVPSHHQGARGRGVRRDREPARCNGLLHRLQGRPRAVPLEDPIGIVQQHLGHTVVAARRLPA
jgi:NADH-quinone oxidoreductase subunit D